MTSDLRDFKGQVVLVVGAASGIGRATAQLICIPWWRSCNSGLGSALGLASLQGELGLEDNQVKSVDLGNQLSIQQLIASVLADHEQIDALVNTAGMVGPTNTKVEDVDWAAL